ncbi:hypothetical protein DER45DRAFT_190789 [Fusarium avenaceum]|nr:hypothetical protein DER45DRAFT_190789 [Fusarium avenaceum]
MDSHERRLVLCLTANPSVGSSVCSTIHIFIACISAVRCLLLRGGHCQACPYFSYRYFVLHTRIRISLYDHGLIIFSSTLTWVVLSKFTNLPPIDLSVFVSRNGANQNTGMLWLVEKIVKAPRLLLISKMSSPHHSFRLGSLTQRLERTPFRCQL